MDLSIYNKKEAKKRLASLIKVDSKAFITIKSLIDSYKTSWKNGYWMELKDNINSSESNTIAVLTHTIICRKPTDIRGVATSLGNWLCENLDRPKATTLALDLLSYIASETDLVDIDTSNMTIISNLPVSEEIQEYLSQLQYPLPELQQPVWKHGNTYGSSILKRETNNDSLDVLNILSSIELELDTDILEFEEISNKELDTHDKKEQFLRMRDSSTKSYQKILDAGNKFYFIWKYDSRGRVYSQGYEINLQSTKYKKALISLKNKQLVTGEL